MSVVVGVSLDTSRIPLSRARVAEIARAVLKARRVRSAMLSITFVSRAAIRALNREHLGRNGATDVISFAFRGTGQAAAVVGDIYIAPAVARSSARSNGVSVREELTRLVVHGVLHVLGHDHPETESRVRSDMWRIQERLVARLEARRR